MLPENNIDEGKEKVDDEFLAEEDLTGGEREDESPAESPFKTPPPPPPLAPPLVVVPPPPEPLLWWFEEWWL